ncbi:MAG: hypothetical protein ACK4IX_05410 [Candidatus Sericytochromatia bacterium]
MNTEIPIVGNIPVLNGYINLASFFNDPFKIVQESFNKYGNLSIFGNFKNKIYLLYLT